MISGTTGDVQKKNMRNPTYKLLKLYNREFNILKH